MITEDYVSFETAKLLKEKGYWNIATMLYKENGDIVNYNVPLNNKGFSSTLGVFYEAPTIQMAMKWLMEEHNKIIVPDVCINDPISGKIDYYIVGIWYIPKNNGGSFCYTFPTQSTPYHGYSSYKEACEAAIKYCLENLI